MSNVEDDDEGEFNGEKFLGYIRHEYGVHLVALLQMAQVTLAFFIWTRFPGVAIQLWILCAVPVLVWLVARVLEVRTLLYTAYTVCVITSCMWGLVAPWIVRGRFWANLCTD